MECELIFFHKAASQDENLRYDCKLGKLTLDKNAKTLSLKFLENISYV